jgi:fumarate reductase subunit D
MARSNEPLWWSLFSAGGVVAAFFLPATILLTALAVPLGWIDGEQLYVLAQHPLVRLYLFVLISLPLFHAAHRLRHLVLDLGLTHAKRPVAIACYGTAIVGTLLAAVIAVVAAGP